MAGVKNRVALVTGAGSAGGIGFATAKALLQAGARVAITSTTDRIFTRCAELNGHGCSVFAHPADLTVHSEVQALIAAIEANLGPVDIVINNAGMVQTGHDEPSGFLSTTSDATWQRGIDINLSSAFYVTREVLPGMQARGHGRIVHMSSVTGPVASIAGSGVYAAAKAGLVGLARTLAIEFGQYGITANCIGPGWIKTESSGQDEIIAGRHTPAGRPGSPEEVAHAAVFLASDEASYINGQLLVVDGGNTIQEYKIALP